MTPNKADQRGIPVETLGAGGDIRKAVKQIMKDLSCEEQRMKAILDKHLPGHTQRYIEHGVGIGVYSEL